MKSKGSSLLAAFTHPSEKSCGESGQRHQPPAPWRARGWAACVGRPPAREPGTCTHTHAGTRTTISPHVHVPVVSAPCAPAATPLLHCTSGRWPLTALSLWPLRWNFLERTTKGTHSVNKCPCSATASVTLKKDE